MFVRPLEYALIEFKGNQFSGKTVPEPRYVVLGRMKRSSCPVRLL
jgi:hypothetical protein